MTFVGDIMFGRYRESGLDRNPETDIPIFDEVEHLIASDMAVANLETPLLRRLPARTAFPSDLLFGAGPWAGALLAQAGFHAVSMANNHVHDMRGQGILDTLDILKQNGIVAVGAPTMQGSPFRVVTVERKGWRIGFISVTGLRNSIDRPGMMRLPYIPKEHDVPTVLSPVIEDARSDHDIVIVLIHWGAADADHPSGTRAEASHRLIDRGVTMVIGHHPHVLQGIERYKGGLIAHSLGDFLFDKILDKHRLTGVLRVGFEPDRAAPIEVRFHPVIVTRSGGDFKPVPALRAQGALVAERMVRLSKKFGASWEREGHDLAMNMGN